MRKIATAWFHLFRPWSYAATLVPFLVAASVFGFARGANWLHWSAGLVVGLLFQSTVNLLNTWGDERSGVDDVPGAIRTTPQVHDGIVSLRAVFAAAAVCALLACAGGICLCMYAVPAADGGTVLCFNRELLVAGAVGCLGSINYSTGIKFKYHGLGVPFVSFLMGPLEVFVAATLLRPGFGIEWATTAVGAIQLLSGFASFVLWTLPVAALVGVIMHGNDMRDIPTDRAAGITTLASRLGPRGALAYYRVCHVVPYAVCVVFAALAAKDGGLGGALFMLPFLCLPLTVRTLRTAAFAYRDCPPCPKWRRLERASGGIHLVFGVLYSASMALWLSLGEAG